MHCRLWNMDHASWIILRRSNLNWNRCIWLKREDVVTNWVLASFSSALYSMGFYWVVFSIKNGLEALGFFQKRLFNRVRVRVWPEDLVPLQVLLHPHQSCPFLQPPLYARDILRWALFLNREENLRLWTAPPKLFQLQDVSLPERWARNWILDNLRDRLRTAVFLL